jgi:cytochrome c-type biogenesis protein CcmF
MDVLGQLSHFYLPGALAIWCAVIFAVCSFWGYTQAVGGDPRALTFARRGYTFFALSIVLAAAVLLLALYRRDFRIEYVYQYSGLDLPIQYQLAAFWAGQKGSFLIWLLWGVLLGLPLRKAAGRDEPTVMGVYLLTLFGLLFILARENPFIMLPEAPADGQGLNPLLQDSWMVIHPPVMFIGYASTAIPFAFAFAAMWRRDTSSWAARAFPWALGGFLVLGAAILMGGYWAYRTLGWGGYWGWDPVENASLIPWLVGVVLIHGLYLEKTRQRFRRMNLVIACVLYFSVLYGTFLTRSGVLADFSVHSFVDLGISGWLIALMAFFAFGSIYLLATRLRAVETQPNEDPLVSRGSWMMLATIVVGLSTLVIAIGTSAPLITGWLAEQPGQVGPEFYNTVNMPLALLIAALLASVPFLTWKEMPLPELGRKMLPSLGVALVATMVGFTVGVHEVFHLLFLFLATAALASNLLKVISLARNGGLKGIGGYLAHVGVGIMLLGILASSAYDRSAKITLPQGVAVQVDEQTEMTFTRFLERQGHLKERMEVMVTSKGKTFPLYPKLFVNDRTNQLMVNPDIDKGWLRDLYISPIEYLPPEDPSQAQVVQLAKGDTARFGDLNLQFVDFVFDRERDPMIQLAGGGQVEIKARLLATLRGERQEVEAVYRFGGSGAVETPASALPGRGQVAIEAIDPQQGRIRVEVTGAADAAKPARLSIDVTHKPLIFLVWAGLYVILAGGLLSVIQRWRQARQVDEINDRIAAANAT